MKNKNFVKRNDRIRRLRIKKLIHRLKRLNCEIQNSIGA